MTTQSSPHSSRSAGVPLTVNCSHSVTPASASQNSWLHQYTAAQAEHAEAGAVGTEILNQTQMAPVF